MNPPSIEIYRESSGREYLEINGPITDVHMHPRIFDALLLDQGPIPNGKAGLGIYTETAMRSGFSSGIAMTNEYLRIINADQPDMTEAIPYPVNNVDRLLAAANLISQNSKLPMAINMTTDRTMIGLEDKGFDRKKLTELFANPYVLALTAGLKIFGDESTGGYNIPLEYIIPTAEIWHEFNPGKPVVLHLEDENVAKILDQWPMGIPVHIAHVSSIIELGAVIDAKERGLDVTCEVTPHHSFLTDATQVEQGPYGCMKPGLKPEADRRFLWDNLGYIDSFASDCAPHREIDKVGIDGRGLEKPAFGVTNHVDFMPLYIGAILSGQLTPEQLRDRIITNPRSRFNLPELSSVVRFEIEPVDSKTLNEDVQYGCDVFEKTSETPIVFGRVDYVEIAGRIAVKNGVPRSVCASYGNLTRF